MKKVFILCLFLLIPLVQSAVVPTISDFSYVVEPRQNEFLSMSFTILDLNIPVANTPVKIYTTDARGVLVQDYSLKTITRGENVIQLKPMSNDVGEVYFNLLIDPRYRLDQNYSLHVVFETAKEENPFTIQVQQLETDYVGDAMRWIAFNFVALAIGILFSLLVLAFIWSIIVKGANAFGN